MFFLVATGGGAVFPQLPLYREAPPAGGYEDRAAASGRNISPENKNSVVFALCALWTYALLSSCQVDAFDPYMAADAFLKIASLYSEEPGTRTAVLETIGKYNAPVLHSVKCPPPTQHHHQTALYSSFCWCRVMLMGTLLPCAVFILVSLHRCCAEEAPLCLRLSVLLLPFHTSGHDGAP